MKRIGIIGVGKYVPEKVLTNADLEKMVETSDEWIITRTGIRERRVAGEKDATSDLASRAALQALADAGLQAKDIDLIIVATITPDMQFPSTACFVQEKIGASRAFCFDVSAACSGFIYALATARSFIASGAYRNALVIGAEILTRITDWKDRSTCVLFGDGAGAAVLSEVPSAGILSAYMGTDGSKTGLLNLPGGGSRFPASAATLEQGLHFLKMQGNELFKIAVNSMADAAQKALEGAKLACVDVSWIIPHQANIRIINALAKRLGFVNAKVFLNIEKYGNMSSASTATALCEAVKEGGIKKGDIVLLDAFGAGLVWGAMVMEW